MPDNNSLIAKRPDPASFKLAPTSAARLAAMTDIPAEKIVGKTLVDIDKLFPHRIDPAIFLFRRICGRVVKTDPVTGIDYPVPFATVQVEDTDCSFLGYFPVHSPWSWYFPFRCHREVIATAKTDACGNFCVWVPRFDIDWVLRFRRERKCFPIIFERPNLRDIIDHVIPRQIPKLPFPPRPGPGPDPAPFAGIDRSRFVTQVSDAFGRNLAVRLSRLSTSAGFGTSTVENDAALDAPALLEHIRPPLSKDLKALDAVKAATDKHSPTATTLGARLSIDPSELKAVDLRNYIGPFKRCFDVFFPEWTPIIDVPDITFRVLQDTNGDGVEEQIYGEGYFQVRWDAGTIGPVTLHAGPNAHAAPLCGPTNIPCGNVPAIVMAGRLPVTGDPLVYNGLTGYAVRTNRPHPSGLYADPLPLPEAQSPLAGVLSLYGCNKTDPAATHYRLVYRYSANRGVTWTASTPFTGLTWPLYRLNGMGIGEWFFTSADAQGWYPIALPAGPNPWLPQDLLLDWPSYGFANGLYAVTLEVGTGGVATSHSAEVSFTIDNSAPTGVFTVETATSAAGPFTPIDGVCPVVRRGVTPHDMFFRVTFDAAAIHMRSVEMTASGCGGGDFVFVSGTGGAQAAPGSVTYRHWHTDPADNDQLLQVIYRLPASALEGTYSIGGEVSGRAFNPSGGDGGHLAVPPWQYDPDQSHIYPSLAFSVFNSNP